MSDKTYDNTAMEIEFAKFDNGKVYEIYHIDAEEARKYLRTIAKTIEQKLSIDEDLGDDKEIVAARWNLFDDFWEEPDGFTEPDAYDINGTIDVRVDDNLPMTFENIAKARLEMFTGKME